jgi:hypothetical protein
MKKIFMLSDGITRPVQLLQNTTTATIPRCETQAVTGCNCDRWGHPCPGCVEVKTGPKAETPVSSQVKP